MGPQTNKSYALLLLFLGLAVLAPCAFFAYYSIRLLYVNFLMSAAEAEVHRTGGMLIGAFAFPIATLCFGAIGFVAIRAGIHRLRPK